ncbi:hypothetical protein F2Q68_00038223 [Brassica cretica]|uniref:Replication factor A C-terminal domain-containing protein n=1 Tax=Brassica cretica TaxID=69181 RepID=A0A8S9MPX8_BRACR|nr:hypothetical protein F2Q68_00038223 [Brassica cretica]
MAAIAMEEAEQNQRSSTGGSVISVLGTVNEGRSKSEKSENCFLENRWTELYRVLLPRELTDSSFIPVDRASLTVPRTASSSTDCEVVLLRSSQEILCVLLVDVSTSSEDRNLRLVCSHAINDIQEASVGLGLQVIRLQFKEGTEYNFIIGSIEKTTVLLKIIKILDSQATQPIADEFPSEVPEKYFADYNDIVGGKLDNSRLVDVIGQIVNFGSLENKVIKGKDNLRLLIELRDQNNVKMMCTLWGCYAKQVYDYTDEFPSEVPEKYFADYNDIVGGKLDNSRLVDVIGQIVNFGSLENKVIKGKDNLRLLIELRDQNNVKMMCTLWGCYAKQVYDYSAYSISSGYNSTHILLNPTLDFIEEFKASLPNDSLALTNNDSSQWSVGTATSVRARFFVLNERLTIREIIDSTLNKKVMPTTNVDADNRPLFFCNTCDKEHIEVISRFKLIAHVKDDFGEANFLLFDTNAQLIVRHSAAELYDENEDPEFLPEVVSDLFGKRVLFEISVDADNVKGKSSHPEMTFPLVLVVFQELLCLKEKVKKIKTIASRINKKHSQKKVKGE